MIEYARQAPEAPPEVETCVICNEDFPLDVCIVVREKFICECCVDDIENARIMKRYYDKKGKDNGREMCYV